MGKKSRRSRPGGGGNKKKGSKSGTVPVQVDETDVLNRRIHRPEEWRVRMDFSKANFIRLSANAADQHDITDSGFAHREMKRFAELVKFCSYFDDARSPRTKEDYNFLKNLCKPTTTKDDTAAASTAACIKAQAFYFLANWKQAKIEYEDAIQCFYYAIQICEEARDDPREPRPVNHEGIDFLSTIQENSKKSVTAMNTMALFDRKGNKRNLDLMGGKECDACGKKRPPSNDFKMFFKCCGRCQKTFYCSEGCQRSHWKRAHKQQCRKPGEFKVGDYAYHYSEVTNVAVIVELIRWEEETSTWLVAGKKHLRNFSFYTFGRPLPARVGRVQTKNLRRFRPVLWEALAQASYWAHRHVQEPTTLT